MQNIKTIKKAGIITAATLTAAGASIALAGMDANAAELDTKEINETVSQKTETGSQVSLEDAKAISDKAKESLDTAEQEVTQAGAALDSANREKAEADAAYDAACKNAEEAFAGAVNKAENDAASAEQSLNEKRESLEGAENAAETAEGDVAAAEQAVEEADRKLEEAKAADPAAEDVQNAENALADAEAAQKAAEEATHKAGEKQEKAEQAALDAEAAKEQTLSDKMDKESALSDAEADEQAAITARMQAEAEAEKAAQTVGEAVSAKNAADEAVAAAAEALNGVREQAKKEVDDNIARLKADETAKESAVDEAKAALDAAEENYLQGSMGFIKWMLSKEDLTEEQKNDLNKALQKLEEASRESFSNFGKTPNMDASRNNMVISIGDPKDATALPYVRAAIDIMKNINELRASDDNFVGDMSRDPAKTNFYFMALGQICTMRGAGLRDHSIMMASCENLAWGFTNPNAGWYTAEKKIFDAIKNDLGITELTPETLSQIKKEASKRGKVIGHYTNLMYTNDQLMGVGMSAYGRASGYTASTTKLGARLGKTGEMAVYSVEEFEALFNEYFKTVDTAECQNSYDAAVAALTAATAEREALETGREAAIEAAATEVQKNLRALQQEAIQAASRLEAAKGAEAAAAEKLKEAKAAEAAAKETSLIKKADLKEAETAVKKAEEALAEAVRVRESAAAEAVAANEELAHAKADTEAARSERDRLIALLDNSAVGTALAEQQAAKEKVLQARTSLQTAKDYLEQAKQDYADAVIACESANDLAQRARNLPAVAPEMDMVEDSAFIYLNEFIQNMRKSAEKAVEAEKRVEEAKSDLAEKQESLEKARVNYTAAYADYQLLKTEADKVKESAGLEQKVSTLYEEHKNDVEALKFDFVEWSVPEREVLTETVYVPNTVEKTPEIKDDKSPHAMPKNDTVSEKEQAVQDNAGTVITNTLETQKQKSGLLWYLLGGIAALGAGGAAVGVGVKRRKRKED